MGTVQGFRKCCYVRTLAMFSSVNRLGCHTQRDLRHQGTLLRQFGVRLFEYLGSVRMTYFIFPA